MDVRGMQLPELTLITNEPSYSRIEKGEVLVDLRDIKDYYTKKLMSAGLIYNNGEPSPDPLALVTFKKGFAKDADNFKRLCRLNIKADAYEFEVLNTDVENESDGVFDDTVCTDAVAEAAADAFRLPAVPDNIRQDFAQQLAMQEDDRELYLEQAKELRDYLDKFLSPHKCKDLYEREERYSEYGFEKARKKLQELYEIAVR